MPMPVLAVKSFDSSTNALAGSQAAQHSVMVLPCACAGVVAAPMPSAAIIAPPATKSAFMVFFMRISLHVNRPATWRGVPARSNASSSATQSDELNKLNRRSSRSSGFLEDPARLDLFSKSRFTKHCKWARDDSVETQFCSYADAIVYNA